MSTTDHMPAESNLNNPRLTTLLFACLVKKLGGHAEITQADIDAVAYNRLMEEGRALRADLARAERAAASGDVVAMLQACQALAGYEE